MAIGMTYEQYWYGDPLMVRAFYKAYKVRQQQVNTEAWLYGAYVYRALDATVGNAFRKKGAEMAAYPQKPAEINLGEEETDFERAKREEQEAVFAQAYMTNMVFAGKNWKKKE